MGRNLGKVRVDDSQGLSDEEWHQRYSQQAAWTQDIRRYLFEKVTPRPGAKVLEVGSGTGAVLAQIGKEFSFSLTGVDIHYHRLVFAQRLKETFNNVTADGYKLPFPDDMFSSCFCHYLLLWLGHPQDMLTEMCRVTQPGGFVIALAEPDHQARIDYPPPLEKLGSLQTQALKDQGVDTAMGRKLGALFQETGLKHVETGILGAQWHPEVIQTVDQNEWMMIQSDLGDIVSKKELENYRQVDQKARQQGKRVLFVPTFYACGLVP